MFGFFLVLIKSEPFFLFAHNGNSLLVKIIKLPGKYIFGKRIGFFLYFNALQGVKGNILVLEYTKGSQGKPVLMHGLGVQLGEVLEKVLSNADLLLLAGLHIFDFSHAGFQFILAQHHGELGP